MTIAALYLFAFAMKAAAFPLNFWLPASYHTPRIVVSALFAGLLTKVGVYALLRVMVMMFPLERAPLGGVIGWIAALTMIVGALGALAQTDLRRLLGFLVVSGIGSMLAGIALGGDLAVAGTIVYAVHSMVVMAALYLATGIIGRRTGTFDLNALGGLYSASPWFAAGFLVLAFAVSGLPPFSGFWPKLMLVQASLAAGNGWLAGAILATGLLTTIAIVRVFLFAFWRDKAGGGAGPAPLVAPGAVFMSGSLAALVAGALAIGLAPEMLTRAGLDAAGGLIAPAAYIDSVFPGGR
jgi:multicomponent Na+:H+ antiporter subunit D